MTLDEFFTGYEESRPLFDAVQALVDSLGETELRVTKSQIAFVQGRPFAWAWVPGRYLGGSYAPLVLSVVLPARDASARWKEVVEPAPGRFMHHLELRAASELDSEVLEWLQTARAASG